MRRLDAPIDAEDVVSSSSILGKGQIRAFGEQCDGYGGDVGGCKAGAERRRYVFERGQGEYREIMGRKLAGPRVENLEELMITMRQ